MHDVTTMKIPDTTKNLLCVSSNQGLGKGTELAQHGRDGATGNVFQENTQLGKVFKALNMRTGSLFAVKKLVLDGAPQSQVAALQREISVLQKLKHENIVRYLGTERAKRVRSGT